MKQKRNIYNDIGFKLIWNHSKLSELIHSGLYFDPQGLTGLHLDSLSSCHHMATYFSRSSSNPEIVSNTLIVNRKCIYLSVQFLTPPIHRLWSTLAIVKSSYLWPLQNQLISFFTQSWRESQEIVIVVADRDWSVLVVNSRLVSCWMTKDFLFHAVKRYSWSISDIIDQVRGLSPLCCQ